MKVRLAPINFSIAEHGITQSLLGDWCKCKRLGKFKIEGWEAPLEREPPAFGSLYHKLLEEAYNSIRLGSGVPDFQVLADKWMKSTVGRNTNQKMMETMLAKAFAIWEPYWDYWVTDITDIQWVASEAQFDVDFHGFRLRGMRDGIFLAKGTTTLLESKTKTRINPYDLLEMLPMDWQNQFYLTASRLEGTTVRHVLYNCIRRPQLIHGKKESLLEYRDRMQASVAKDPEKYFIRFNVSYSEKTLADFEAELLLKLRSFRRWLDDPTETWKVQGACQSFWNCEYLEACSSGDMVGYTQTRQMHRELE